jgi:hypothetical protein
MAEHSRFTEVTDIDFSVAMANAREQGDIHSYGTMIRLFKDNPRFVLNLLSEAHRRAELVDGDATTKAAVEDAIIEGAALMLAAQEQTGRAQEPILPDFEGQSSVAA